MVKAPSTLGTFLRSFRWGHVRQLDRVSRQLLARAWAAGAGPGDSPLTIDLDSTICETYGLAKEGARHHGYTGARGYHPLLAIAAGTGEVLMSRLREGRANTARGAAHFLRETVGVCATAGPGGQLTVRADSGFYAHTVVAACREMDVRFSMTIRQRASLRDLIEAIPEEDWTPIPYWMDGADDVAETTYTPFQTKPDAAPVRLIVRRVKPTPGSQLWSGGGAAGTREAWRLALFSVLAPLGKLVESELQDKLEDSVTLSWQELRASDLSGRARAFQSMVDGGMEVERAAGLAGLMVTDD